MCDDDDASAVASELPYMLKQQQTCVRIEPRGWFVEQQIRCLECKHVGDGDTALLAPGMGKGARVTDDGGVEPYGQKRGVDALLNFSLVQSKVARPKCNFIKDVGGKKLLLGTLLYQCHGHAVRTKFICRGTRAKCDPVRLDRPCLLVKCSGKDAQQRRLARAGGAANANHTAGHNLKRYVM